MERAVWLPREVTEGKRPLKLALFGSTGSIGIQALQVATAFPQKIEIVALAAYHNVGLLASQARTFGVHHLAMGDRKAAQQLRGEGFAQVLDGREGLCDLVDASDADLVLNAIMGFAGLAVTVATLRAGLPLALANKESLVAAGDLVMPLIGNTKLLPVDSEHSALYQCLLGEDHARVKRLWITASGGPFYGKGRGELAGVKASDALAHPTWSMGPKITIDSATLMNKGLEIIEAHHLFDFPIDMITPVIQRQSTIHSMVEYTDGSVIAHLGVTDMRIPIQYALSCPDRWAAPQKPLDFTKLGTLDFGAPDLDTFGCLALALEAGHEGGTLPTVLNAANEAAVGAFLKDEIGFLDIEDVVRATMELHDTAPLESFEHVEAVDAWARRTASEFIAHM